ncbi:MAG: DUF1501 domain-containing protein [Planctomycetota bacterium]
MSNDKALPFAAWNRRQALQVGALGALGLSVPSLGQGKVQAAAAVGARRAKRCLVFYLHGGPSQHDTWDPKPDAPAEVRGPFGQIATSVPGMFVGGLMPRVARLAHHCCVLRSVATGDNSHASSVYQVLTGSPHSPANTETAKAGAPNDRPHFASALRQVMDRGQAVGMPSFVTLPEIMSGNDFTVFLGQNAGNIGRRYDPWVLLGDPSSPGGAVPPSLGLPEDVSADRLSVRRTLLQRLEAAEHAMERSGMTGEYGRHAERAYEMLRSAAAGRAFELERESATVRDRYGRTKVGQSVLLGRRLLEAGVPLVQVNWPREPNDRASNNPVWDTHSNHNPRMKDVLMPQMDQTFSALLEDLEQRGMLEETLVVWLGEFGRTPRFNGGGGRDHWGGVFSIVLAGGGVRGGTVLGASDRLGAFPQESPIAPSDVLATICQALGFDPSTVIYDTDGRPHPLSRGEVIRGAL